MQESFNRFQLSGYFGPEFFCDRAIETQKLLEARANQRNITLISNRRLGKTVLLWHAFGELEKKRKDVVFVYMDIMKIKSIKAFAEYFGGSVFAKTEKVNSTTLKKLANFFSSLNVKMGFDALTGQPTFELGIGERRDELNSLEKIFEYIRSKDKSFIICFDEFQQIESIGSKEIIAALRPMIAQTPNATFVFSGSKRTMLSEMFADPKGVFFQSAEIMHLGPIDRGEYEKFIRENMAIGKKTIDEEGIELIFELTRGATYYVQYICNRLYSQPKKKIDRAVVAETFRYSLLELNYVYEQIAGLITKHQLRVLRAIAAEGLVAEPLASDFLSKYELGAASSVAKTLKTLEDKELILAEPARRVYDPFFEAWLNSF
ncbi:MAG: AAA family ATPase [Chloroflexota bacterium]